MDCKSFYYDYVWYSHMLINKIEWFLVIKKENVLVLTCFIHVYLGMLSSSPEWWCAYKVFCDLQISQKFGILFRSFLEAFPFFQRKMLLLFAWSFQSDRGHWNHNSPFRVLTPSAPLFFSVILTSAFIHSVRPSAYHLRFYFSTQMNKNKTSVFLRWVGKKYPPNFWSFCVLGDLSNRSWHMLELIPVFSLMNLFYSCLYWVFRAHKLTLILWVNMPLHTLITVSSSLLSQTTWFLCLSSILGKLLISLITVVTVSVLFLFACLCT